VRGPGEQVIEKDGSVRFNNTNSHFYSATDERVEKGHTAAQFAACVDAAPLIHEHFIYGACQGGVVQRIDVSHSKDIPFCFLLGEKWKVQADKVLI
jgi:hypothetical protein